MSNSFYESLRTLPSDTLWQLLIIFILYTLFISFILHFFHKNKVESLKQDCDNEKLDLEYKIDELEQKIEALKFQLEKERVHNARFKTKIERINDILDEKQNIEVTLEQCRDKNGKLQRTIGSLTAQLSEERKISAKQLIELKEYHNKMREDFKQIATNILMENSQEYAQISKEKVANIIEPFKEEMASFRHKIENIHIQESKELSSLKNELGHIRELNSKLSNEALRLSRALEGESKTQGIWGEMVLEKVLEISGLREGIEYDREVTLYNESKQKYRPDVIVHLPDNRDIIIDAKTSLRDYVSYVNSGDKIEKEYFASKHTEAIKEHIKRLSQKDYGALEGINNLDLVLMFIPIEGALELAQKVDERLYERAYKNNIVLVTPSSLLTALRAIEQSWRVVRQNQNALEIAKKAGKLYDKFVSLLEDIDKMSRQIDMLRGNFDNTIRKIGEGRDNLISQCQSLKELGARTSKELPQSYNISDTK